MLYFAAFRRELSENARRSKEAGKWTSCGSAGGHHTTLDNMLQGKSQGRDLLIPWNYGPIQRTETDEIASAKIEKGTHSRTYNILVEVQSRWNRCRIPHNRIRLCPFWWHGRASLDDNRHRITPTVSSQPTGDTSC